MNNLIATTIRINEETKTAIEDIAMIEQRSFNKEVEYILQKYIFEWTQEKEKEDTRK